MKKEYQSKTLWTNLAIVALAVWFRESDFYIDPMVFVLVIAAVNIWLRLVTRTAIGRRPA